MYYTQKHSVKLSILGDDHTVISRCFLIFWLTVICVFRQYAYRFLFHAMHFTNSMHAVVLPSLLCHSQLYLGHIIFIFMAHLCHVLSFSALRTTTFCLSCSLNLNGKLFGYISHWELCQDDKLTWGLPLTCGNLHLHCIQGAVLFPLQPANHRQITVLSSCSFSAGSTTMHIRALQGPKIWIDFSHKPYSPS